MFGVLTLPEATPALALPNNSVSRQRIVDIMLCLDRLVSEYGPSHTSECHYVERDINGEAVGPECIAGQVLFRLNLLSLDELKAHEGTSANNVTFELLHWDYPERAVLQVAQHIQDGGSTWGEAREQAQVIANVYGVY